MGRLYETYDDEEKIVSRVELQPTPPRNLSGLIETIRFLEMKFAPLIDTADAAKRLELYHERLLNDTEIAEIIESVICEMGIIIWQLTLNRIR
jgi:hypothetical protein